ncbi:MAG: hypothetical protein H7A06_02330 [Pseudomonadales bacterium]|nr:hypothetical protein [Pseudomonadales bacterium]
MNSRFNFALSLLLLGSSLPSALQAAEMVVSADNGISLIQLDFPSDDVPVMDSQVGLLEANLIQLRNGTGMNTGYLNMVRGSNWVVRNLPVMSDADYPYSHLSVKFDLGVSAGTDVSSLSAVMVFSDTLMLNAPTGTPANFSVGSAPSSQGGMGDPQFGSSGTTSGSPVIPPSTAGISYPDLTNNRMVFQMDHPNIETAHNQCMPASVANSLSFLEKTTALRLPHRNVPGLKGDQSLVGQLDTYMERPMTSRREGQPTLVDKGIKGKLQYLVDNDLHERIATRHWGLQGSNDFSASNGDKTATSKGQGNSLNFNKLIDALEGGEDCEAGYVYQDANGDWNGHAVDLVAAGYMAGKPFMIENSDLNQGSDTLGAGKSGFLFSYLEATSDGFMSMNGTQQTLAFAMCQKYIPKPVPTDTRLPPLTATFYIPGTEVDLLKTTDPAGHSCCAEFPPEALDMLFENGVLILSVATGTTPWLPMTLALDALGGLSGSNDATVAGFGGIHNTITGQVGADKISAQITLGKNGGLPQGQPIIFDVSITPKEPWPWTIKDPDPELTPAIRVNGFREAHTLTAGEPVTIGVSLQPGTNTDTAEWWLVAEAQGSYFSFDAATSNWVPGVTPVISTPAMTLGATSLFTFDGGLPAGEYRFHFGLDSTPNNTLDLEALTVDSIEITVSAP